MAQKTIATLLILSAFAIAGANSASAEGGGFRGGGFHDGSGGFHGRGFHKRSSPVVVGGYGYADNNGSGNVAMELVMELATGTESLPVTMGALSSGSV